jgi:hypothetical protein
MQKKLDIYEKFIKELQEIDKKDEQYNYNPLEESVIIEKDNFGNINKKVRSDLSESFLIIDKGKDLKELNKSEHAIIKEQDSYHKYKNTTEYLSRADGVYKTIGYIIKYGKWLLLI